MKLILMFYFTFYIQNIHSTCNQYKIFFLILFYFLYSRLLLVIYFIHISVYMSIPTYQFIPPPHPPRHFPSLVSIHFFSTSLLLFLPCKLVHLYHFSRFHIYALIYDICFSLSDLLTSLTYLLTSLCMTVYRSIHISTNDPVSFLFMAE